jgi:hypothetical protein
VCGLDPGVLGNLYHDAVGGGLLVWVRIFDVQYNQCQPLMQYVEWGARYQVLDCGH